MINPTRKISTVTCKFSEAQVLVTIDVVILYLVQLIVQLNLHVRKRQNSRKNHAPMKNTNILTVKALYLEPLINDYLS